MAIAGRVAIVPKGDWSADVTYKRLDAVTVNNTLYIAKKSVPAGTATTDTEYWAKSISGGATNVATSTEDGLMAKGDKKKLDGIDGDVAAKLGESKDGSLTYNGTEIKSSVETGKGLSIGEDGKLQVNIDGTTLTMDQVNNVIKLADTLKDAINGAFPAANVANNQITTVEGFALDARQANPNLDGTLAKQISDLNGSLKGVLNEVTIILPQHITVLGYINSMDSPIGCQTFNSDVTSDSPLSTGEFSILWFGSGNARNGMRYHVIAIPYSANPNVSKKIYARELFNQSWNTDWYEL